MTQLTLFESAPEEQKQDEKLFKCLTWADAVKFCLNQVALSCWNSIEISRVLPDGSRWVKLEGN